MQEQISSFLDVFRDGLGGVVTGNANIGSVIFLAASDVFTIVAFVAFAGLLSTLIAFIFKLVFVDLLKRPSIAYFIEMNLTFPGVIFHELSHALLAFLTGATIDEFSLKKHKDETGYILGYVTFTPSPTYPLLSSFQRLMAGIAPAITGTLALLAIILFAFPQCMTWWQWTIWIYLFICIVMHCDLSPNDISNATNAIPFVAVALFTIFLFIPFDPLALVQLVFGFGESSAPFVTDNIAGTPELQETITESNKESFGGIAV